MAIPVLQIDSFTDIPFRGNPAAVCILTVTKSDSWFQTVAAELNAPATAFITPHEDPFKRAYRLRWFTPQIELEICGHGTLAAAHALWTEGHLRPTDTAVFHTKSGVLRCSRNMQGWIMMEFPLLAATAVSVPPADLLDALGMVPTFVGSNGSDYLVEVDGETAVRAFAPDFNQLEAIDMRSLIVTSRSDDSNRDFVSRVFAPSLGIPEDAATGSAHCVLGPYWQAKLGKPALVGHQLSERIGIIRVQVDGEQVKIGGQAVTVMKGVLQV